MVVALEECRLWVVDLFQMAGHSGCCNEGGADAQYAAFLTSGWMDTGDFPLLLGGGNAFSLATLSRVVMARAIATIFFTDML